MCGEPGPACFLVSDVGTVDVPCQLVLAAPAPWPAPKPDPDKAAKIFYWRRESCALALCLVACGLIQVLGKLFH